LKIKLVILFVVCMLAARLNVGAEGVAFNFYGDTLRFTINNNFLPPFPEKPTEEAIRSFLGQLEGSDHQSIIKSLVAYKEERKPDDWLFYQLVRKTAESISPKAENYYRYTLYKWFLLTHTGYDATLALSGDKLLFYVQSDEVIYDIPYRMKDGKQYICLNYHDYGGDIDFTKNAFYEIAVSEPADHRPFSYKVTQLPGFTPTDYQEKDLSFNYHEITYKFKVKINAQVKNIFANYPVTDYQMFFNMPLSNGTYQSLIPTLKKNMKGMNVKNGVDYLMRFTRYAFLYEPDKVSFGKEKRLSPEQTLLYEYSDCEDRSALFFYLVKEIYNLPMIVLAYPEHVTVAVKFDKPVGQPVIYNGVKYSICEPTPQAGDPKLGEMPRALKNESYEVAYVYNP
jgi:hypothetical protein